MPSHQERIRAKNPEMNCEHNWKYAFGVDIADFFVAAKICNKCHLIIKLGHPGIDNIEREWYDSDSMPKL